ncbi:unnamed protein product [Hermetia illucens]|uniref:Invertebrate defensins family profile domain-containing protein n=1 Tax=Hermetia illucens TaxID=343691 RepID=A0A7R8UC55_HERIL|nr:defensin-A-like [Hermetia illucens]CAD7077224.1 unnamed protein product [Hermetia illucens]
MRSLLVLGLIVATFTVYTSAQPYQLEYEEDGPEYALELPIEEEELPSQVVEQHYRAKRATCDLLSPFGVGHAACAVHCIAMGRRGGWCDDRAVCNCRR